MSDNTKRSIVLRINRVPSFEVVPAHAIALFDHVMATTEAEAMRLHPKDKWARVDFFKKEILSRVAPSLRGLVAVQFHEYVAALFRNEDADGFDRVPGYGGEARAQRDAYLACVASLD